MTDTQHATVAVALLMTHAKFKKAINSTHVHRKPVISLMYNNCKCYDIYIDDMRKQLLCFSQVYFYITKGASNRQGALDRGSMGALDITR